MRSEVLKAIVSLLAVGAIVFVEYGALNRGIDGVALSSSIGALAAIGGYWARKARE